MLSTSDFASALGVSESSVRRLADGGDLEIHRTRGGHRRIPIAEAIRYVRENGVHILRPDLLGLVGADERLPSENESDQLLEALRGGHARNVIAVMQSMYASGRSIAEICDGPIHQAMVDIGNSWPSDKRSIFVEHRATLLCVRALCQIGLAIPDPDPDAPTAMGGAPQDDPYLLPSLMVSLVLHDCGYEETNLGPNTPLDVLMDSVEDEQPNLVWLALTNPVRSRHENRDIDRLSAIVTQYGGTFLIGGKSAHSYEGDGVKHCGSMTALNELATMLVKS